MAKKQRIINRKDSLAAWATTNPRLADGELAFVVIPDGSIKSKVGNSEGDRFNDLPYISLSSHNIDGGVPESIYLPTQSFDGGTI